MPHFMALLVFLVCAHPAATAQEPDIPFHDFMTQLLGRIQFQALARSCHELQDSNRRAECLRTVEACAMPKVEAVSPECVRTLQSLRSEAVCSSDELKSDRTACLERRVEVLTKELADLRRDLPEMIAESVRAALKPRLHR